MPFATNAAIDAFGMNMHLRERVTSTKWDDAIDLAGEANIKWAREQFNWDVIEPNDDTFSWTQYDTIIGKYSAANINVVGLITNSSSWSSSNPGSSDYYHYPPDMDAWKDYVYELALHYKDDIDYWEIWNEPNLDGSWEDEVDAEEYATYLKAAYDKITEANPDAKIIIGGMSGTDTVYLNTLFEFIDENYNYAPFDIVAVHPYRVKDDNFNYTPEETVTGLNTLVTDLYNLKATLRKNSHGSVPIWLTEFGWSTYADGVYDKTQASLLMRQIVLALSVPDVNKLFWYDFRDDSDSESYVESNFGILNNNWSKKIAFYTYNNLAERLYGATYQSPQLLNKSTIDDFSNANSWKFKGTLNAEGSITESGSNKLKVHYEFTGEDTNSYAPISKEIILPAKARILQFRAKGTNSTTELRLRVKDTTGEIFQYNIGYLPQEWLTYRVDLTNYSGNWNGDADGKLDRPLKFQSFVLDDNPDGSKDTGNVYFRKLKSSSYAGVHVYKFKKSGLPTYVIWNTNGFKRITLKLSKATRIRVVKTRSTSTKLNTNHKFNLKIGTRPKIIQVITQE